MSSGRFARQKGKRGERATADEIRKAFPKEAEKVRRGYQSRGGHEASDVEGWRNFHVEVKNEKKPSPLAALRQAMADCAPGKIPIAVIRQHRSHTAVILLWTDLLAMLVELDKRKETDNGGHRVQTGKRWFLRSNRAKKRR